MKPLADMMEKDSKCRWGNHINIVVLPLSIGLETDPLVYLSKAKSTMDQKKNSLHAPVLYSILSFIISVFGAKVYKTDQFYSIFVCLVEVGNLFITLFIVDRSSIVQTSFIKHNGMHFKRQWPNGGNQFPWPSNCVHHS